MRAVVPTVLLFLGFTYVFGYGKGLRKRKNPYPGYAPVGFVQPPFFPFPQTTTTKLKPIHVQTTVRFPNGFTRVFYPNKGPNFFPSFAVPPPLVPAPVFPVATNLIRPAPIKTVIPVAPKVEPEPAPIKPIIEKPETLKPVEEVGKPVYGGTFVVNIDRTKGFRPEALRTVQHIQSFERIRLPPPPSPPEPQIPPPQIWRAEIPRPVDRPQNNFFRDNFQFDSRTFEGRFNIVPKIDRQEPIQDFRPPMPQPIIQVPKIDRQEPVQDFRPPIPRPIVPEIFPRPTRLDQTPIRVNRIEIVLRRVPPQSVEEPVIQIQTSHPVVPVLPPEPVPPQIIPPEPIAEINQGPIIPPEGPTRGDVPNIGIISPIPGDQGNVLMDFKEANAASNKLDMVSNEFTEIGGGVSAMRINMDQKVGQLVGEPGPAVNVGPGPEPDRLVDLGMNSGFVSGASIKADNSIFSKEFSQSQSNFAAGDQFIGGGSGFDLVDSININIDPSLGFDFGPQKGPLLGPPDLMAQADIENNLAINNQQASKFEAVSNFAKPAPISMAEASFDNAAFSSKSSKDFSARAGHTDDRRVIRRTTTVRKIKRTLI